METQVISYMGRYSDEVRKMFMELRNMLLLYGTEERMWAKLPSYYHGDRFVRLIPFTDHINIEAEGIISNARKLSDYKITPKGMLQIYVNQDIPKAILDDIFQITLNIGEKI